MDANQLRDLILNDAAASSMADAGNDAGCAARCMAIATPVHVSTGQLTERGLYKYLGATAAETILQKLAGYGATNGSMAAIVRRVLDWLKPANEGIDFGDVEVLQLVDGLTAYQVLSVEENQAIKNLSLRAPTITADHVSAAMAVDRPNGKIE